MKRIFILLFLGAANLFAQSYVPGKLTVIVRDSAMQGIVRGMNGTATLPNAHSLNALSRHHGLIAMRPMSPKPNSAFRRFFTFEFPTNANIQAIKNALENNSFVSWASPVPDEVPQPLGQYIPPDPYMQSVNSWYLNQGTNKADINAPEAWEWMLGSSNVTIAICGGGIDWQTSGYHQSADVAANLWTNPGEIPNNAIDDDNNGYVDDIHGWNFYRNNNDIEYYNSPFLNGDPLWWHGTPMASHAASAIDSCASVHCGVGVAPLCKIMGVPHYSAESIVYAADNGAKVLAYGFGAGSGLDSFVTNAFAAGMIVVNAGGNVLPYGPYDYPPYGVSVAALDSNNVPVTITSSVIKISAPARYTQTSFATVSASTNSYTDEDEVLIGEGGDTLTYYRVVTKTTYGANVVLSIPSNELRTASKNVAKLSAHNTLPQRTQLLGNYPNPFNPATNISFLLGEPSVVTIKLFDILGREIATILNERRNEGDHVIRFDARSLASGVYYYRFSAGTFVRVGKMMVAK